MCEESQKHVRRADPDLLQHTLEEHLHKIFFDELRTSRAWGERDHSQDVSRKNQVLVGC